MLERDVEGLIPLCNFQITTEDLQLSDDLRIRRLMKEEKEVIAERVDPFVSNRCEFGIESTWKQKIESMNMLEIDVRKIVPSTSVVPALRLFDAGDVTYPIVLLRMLGEDPNPLGFHGWASMRAEASQHFGKPLILTGDRADAFRIFLKAISDSQVSTDQLRRGNIRLDIAFNRFNASYWQKGIEDRFIDIMIGFEALLGDQSIEATNRLINRLCLFLGKDDEERLNLKWFLKKSYDTRSAILHGRRIGEAEVMKEAHMPFKTMVFESQRLLARAIKTSLFTGQMYHSSRKDLIELLDACMVSSEMRDALFDQLKSVQHLVFTDAHSFIVHREKK